MAKHVIQENYTFTPSTKTLVINNKWIRQEQLLLITNVTRNTVLFNFSDPTLVATSYTNTIVNNVPQTTIVFTYNTASQASTCLLYTSPSPRDRTRSRMPSSA